MAREDVLRVDAKEKGRWKERGKPEIRKKNMYPVSFKHIDL